MSPEMRGDAALTQAQVRAGMTHDGRAEKGLRVRRFATIGTTRRRTRRREGETRRVATRCAGTAHAYTRFANSGRGLSVARDVGRHCPYAAKYESTLTLFCVVHIYAHAPGASVAANAAVNKLRQIAGSATIAADARAPVARSVEGTSATW